MPWNIQIQFGYLHSNVIMCIATLLTRWRKRQSSKIYHVFNRGIDTMKITALFNHKPGILNNYIRMWFTSLTDTSAGRNMWEKGSNHSTKEWMDTEVTLQKRRSCPWVNTLCRRGTHWMTLSDPQFISLTTIQVGIRIKDIKEKVFGSASYKHYIRRA